MRNGPWGTATVVRSTRCERRRPHCMHLLRARMPQLLLSAQADDSRMDAAQIGGMPRKLPFTTISDVARLLQVVGPVTPAFL